MPALLISCQKAMIESTVIVHTCITKYHGILTADLDSRYTLCSETMRLVCRKA